MSQSSSPGAIPDKVTVLVIGGGPAGSYAASCLAREGADVAVFEADKFPRYHVGESQLASLRHFLRFIDLEKDFEEFGFNKKVGAAFKLNKDKAEGYTNFIAEDPKGYSWNVSRAESDELLLRHSAKCGALVFEETKVTGIDFEGSPTESRPIAVSWKTAQGATGKTTFEYLIDASGRNGIISAKYLKSRKFTNSLKNVASWGYWKNAGSYKPGTIREGAPFFEALQDESGWCWYIPMRGKTSLGIVQQQDISNLKKSQMPPENRTARSHYMAELDLAPSVKALLGNATLIEDDGPAIRSASDFSYHADSYAGPNYRIIGDAGAFIDPFFSSGVHLAMASGLSAAASILSVRRGETTENEAAEWHTSRTAVSYTRFLIVVLSAYRQMRAQDAPVLSDVDENNFDRAFDHFRPIIQGKADTQATKKLSEAELRDTIDFCANAFVPAEPEERQRVMELIAAGKENEIDDAKDKAIVNGMTAQKMMRFEDTHCLDAYVADDFHGLQLRMERGRLGLARA